MALTPDEAEELGRKLMSNLCMDLKRVDVPAALDLIARGASLGFDDDRALSPLLRATHHNLLGVVDAILARGVDVNEKDRHGWTALMIAANYGHAQMAEFLAGKGADIHAVSLQGKTSFALAQENGFREVGDVLIRAERKRQQDIADAERLAAQFQEAVANAHIAQEPIKVGHALHLIKRQKPEIS